MLNQDNRTNVRLVKSNKLHESNNHESLPETHATFHS